MMGKLRRQKRGSVLVEVVFVTLFFMSIFVAGSKIAPGIIFGVKTAEVPSVVADYLATVRSEAGSLTQEDLAAAVKTIRDAGYLRKGEKIQLVVSLLHHDEVLGMEHVTELEYADEGAAEKRVDVTNPTDPVQGIILGGEVVSLPQAVSMLVVEVFRPQDGARINDVVGQMPYHDFSIRTY